jgi:hypothetical protein
MFSIQHVFYSTSRLIVLPMLVLFSLKDSIKKRYVVVYTLICSLTGALTVMCIKGVSTALVLTLQVHTHTHTQTHTKKHTHTHTHTHSLITALVLTLQVRERDTNTHTQTITHTHTRCALAH